MHASLNKHVYRCTRTQTLLAQPDNTPPDGVIHDTPAESVGRRRRHGRSGYQPLSVVAEKRGYAVSGTPDDGNCLFHAIADQLRHAGIHGPWNEHKVRKQCVDWLYENSDYYFHGILIRDIPSDIVWEDYIHEMALDATHGGQTAIIAAAAIYGAKIEILYNTDVIICISHPDLSPTRMFKIGYTGSHYVSLHAMCVK